MKTVAWKVSEHPKSIQSILLLKDVKTVEILKLDKIKLVNRYNYVKLIFNQSPDKEYYILNIHAPQTKYFPGHMDKNTYFCAENNAAVDHILVSRNIAEEGKIENCCVDDDFVQVQKLSDHATVSLDIAV